MATVTRFEDLKVWQKARILCGNIYELIQSDKFLKDYKLKDQINGSSGSVMDNVAEGYGRKGNPEFIQFLTIAHGSAMECRSQLYRAFDRNYITCEKFNELNNITQDISNMLNALINYLIRSDLKGIKYKQREK